MDDTANRGRAAWPPLNEAQRRAVMHGDGPLLVVAGAGTGKTTTLACRVASLMDRGVPPARILLLTFTRRAAETMLRRAAALARAPAAGGRPWGGTFHAAANRLLRIHAHAVGLDPDFTVIDASDAADLMHAVRQELGLASRDRRFPRKSTCLAIYSRCVNADEDLGPVLERVFPWCAAWGEALKRLFRAYVERKQRHRVLDYDDLLLYWRQALEDPGLARAMGGRFDHVLVDEVQDTNRVQADILAGLRRERPNLTAVGDDAQSIYGFRAADPRGMLEFPKRFPGTTVVTIEENYRSTQPILDAANRLIAGAAEGYAKTLRSGRDGPRPRLVACRDEAAQTEAVVRAVLDRHERGLPLRDMAVLFRTAYHSDALEVELGRRGIPYRKYGGLRFLEAAHVKDLVALLRIAENPRDEMAWLRVLQLIEGVGPATAAGLAARVTTPGAAPRVLREAGAPAAARAALAALADLLEALGGAALPPAAQVARIARFYGPLLETRYPRAEARRADLESLEQIAAGYRSRRAFLHDLVLDPPQSTGDWAGPPVRDDDWLVLSTIHSAKGCEWESVVLIHAADGCLPSDMATGSAAEIEEERRLAYVALTRARRELAVFWPMRYYHPRGPHTDRHSTAQRCRFFTAEVAEAFEAQTEGVSDDDPASGEAGGAPLDLPARIRARWD